MISTRTKGILLTAAGALWGAAYLVPYKVATTRVGPEGLVLPMLIAAAVLNTFSIGVWRARRPIKFNRTSLIVAILLGAFSALGNEAMAHSLTVIDPGIAAVMLRSQVVFVAVIGWWLLKERVGIRFWVGTLLALAGFSLLQGLFSAKPGAALSGLVWAVVAAIGFAAMQVTVRKTIKRIDPIMVNGLRLWFAALLVACIPGRLTSLFEVDYQIWLLASATALFGPVISRIFLMNALRYIPVALSTLVLFVSPVFAFLLGGLFFFEWPDLLQLTGCLIILTGIALPVLEKSKSS
jgi:drug/metabolite transporter (DMT)-like permease